MSRTLRVDVKEIEIEKERCSGLKRINANVFKAKRMQNKAIVHMKWITKSTPVAEYARNARIPRWTKTNDQEWSKKIEFRIWMKAISMMRDFGGKINKNPRHTKDVEKQCGRYGKSNKRIALWKYYMGFFLLFFQVTTSVCRNLCCSSDSGWLTLFLLVMPLLMTLSRIFNAPSSLK